jgi:hypothetical protein
MKTSTRASGVSAAGAAAWTVLLVAWLAGLREVTIVTVLLGLGPTIVVPLGLGVVEWHTPPAERLRRLAIRLMPLGAVAVVVSLLLSRGFAAAAAATIWLAVCAVVSLSGLLELAAQRSLRFDLLLRVAACGYLSVGGGWFVLSRYGATPLGFGETIVELTAVHFHFAAFAAPLIAWLAASVARRRTHVLAAVCEDAGMAVVVAMPIVAVGQTSSQTLEVVGSAILGTGLVVLAGATFVAVARHGMPMPSRLLLAVSAVSVPIAMVLAVDFAIGGLLGTPALSIDTMARTHGVLNGVGFSLFGLLGWRAAASGLREP